MKKSRTVAKDSSAKGMSTDRASTAPSRRFRSAMSSMIAATMIATSATGASADTFYFRFKTPVSLTQTANPPGEDSLGQGNDITIFFAGVIGRSFTKSIPVKIKGVAEWRIVSGSIQPGLRLDSGTGIISGVAEGPEAERSVLLKGYDVSGRLVARADISFRFHDTSGDAREFTFYGHVGKYMYDPIPSTVPVDHWQATTDLPTDFHTEGSFLAGTPSKEYRTDAAFIGYDYMGDEIAFAYGDLLVENGPQVLSVASQNRHPSETFDVRPSVPHSIGALDWRLVPLDGKPSSIRIDRLTGWVHGTIPTFSTSLRFQVQAMDVDGTIGTSNVFTLSTAAADIDISALKNLRATVGIPYSIRLKANELVGTASWKLIEGKLPSGLVLNPDTGVISGTPVTPGVEKGLVVSVSTSEAGFDQSGPFTFTVEAVPLAVAFDPADVRVGSPFTTAGPSFGTGIVPPYSFSVDAPVDPSLSVDLAAAKVSGTPLAAGDLSVPFTFHNGDGADKTVPQIITAFNPLSLSYQDMTVFRRLPADGVPKIGANSVIGSAAFKLSGATLPDGLVLDGLTGVVKGVPDTMDGTTGVKVTVSDESGESVDSNLFDIDVEDRPDVVSEGHDVNVERLVGNNVAAATARNVFDGVSFSLVSGDLPDGLSLDEDGIIRGVTNALPGIYGGLRVQAVDGEGYSAISEPFAVTVIQPVDLAPLSDTVMKGRWTQGVPFALQLPKPSNAWGSVTYSFLGLPAGVAVVDGKLVGSVSDLGIHDYVMAITDEAGRVLSGKYSLEIVEAMTAELDGPGLAHGEDDPDDITFGLPRGSAATISATLANAIEPVAYDLKGTLPSGLTFANGTISGKPLVEGDTGQFTLTVSDAAGTTVPLPAAVKVLPRLPLALSYDVQSPAGIVGTSLAVLKPVVSNSIGNVSFNLDGTLPPGLSIDPKTGYIYGVPTKEGIFSDLVVTATDADGGASYAGTYGPFQVGIALPGTVSMAANTFLTVRAGEAFESSIAVGNVTAPVVFGTASGDALANGVALDSLTGKVSGLLPDAGKYPMGAIVAIDAFDRQGSTALTINAVGPLSISPPVTDEMHQYSSVGIKAKAINAIGASTFEILSGRLPTGLSLDPKSGSIGGTPTVKGVSSGIVVRVTDSTGSSAKTAPFALTVGDRLPLTMDTAESYVVTANGNFSLVMPVQNAVGAVSFSQTGTLPDGISFDATTGTFSGVTRVLGSYPGIAVKVTDSVGASVTSTFAFVSQVSGPIRLFFSDYATRVGAGINTGATLWLNTIGAVSFSDDDGALAAHGLALDPLTGRVTGTATELMDFHPNISITDETNRVTSGTFNLKVVPALLVNAPERIELAVSTKIASPINVTASNSTSDKIEWDIQGVLPAGMTFSKTYARFSGTPREFGEFPVEVFVREVDGFQDWASKRITIAIVSDGKAPTVAVTTNAAGYDISAAATIMPKYGNAKVGDVLSLAPGSAPLPPGMTIEKNSAGSWVLKKAVTDAATAGIYRSIKVKVTNGAGLYGESDPFTVVYKTSLAYPAVKVNAQAYVPVVVPAATPSKGRASGDLAFSFVKDFSGGTLKIDAKTGAITGYVLASGSSTVQVTESYDGVILRKVTYTVTFTTTQVGVAINRDLVTYTDMPFPGAVPGYAAKVSNPVAGSVLSVSGALPSGVSFVPGSGAFVGTPSTAGDYPLQVIYTDQYQTISQPLTLHVEQSDPDGYRYARVLWTKINGGYLHAWNYVVHSQAGYDLMHIVPMGTSTISSETQAALKSKTHVPTTILKNQYQVWNFPVGISKGSITLGAHGTSGGTLLLSVSKDGQNWVDLATETVTDTQTNYREPFEAKPVKFAFNTVQMPQASKRLAYSLDLGSMIDDGSLSSVKKADLAWSWELDPARDTSTTMSALPAGLTLSGTTISGTPVNSGVYALLLSASYQGKTVQKQFVLTVKLQTTSLSLAAAPLPSGAGATTYSYDLGTALTATNIPRASVKWAATAGTPDAGETAGLPSGITLSQAGILTGTPTVAGTFVFNVTATFDDANPTVEHVTATRSYKITTSIVSLASLTQVVTGDRHTCAVKPNGTAFCWGLNSSGQLGIGNTTSKSVPTALTGLSSGVASISPGGTQTCAIKTDGTVYCWGNGVTSPAKVNGIGAATQVSAFGDRVCAVTVDKKSYCWTGTAPPSQPVGLEKDVAYVSAGYGYQCAVKTDGTLWCWGGNGNGILGIGSTSAQTNPTQVTALSDVAQVAAGWRHTCAVKTDGTVYCWGLNGHGQVGDNSSTTRTSPTQVQGISGANQVAVGYDFSCAVKTDGGVMCWGFGENGKIGVGGTGDKWLPVGVSGLSSGSASVWIGGAQACVVKTDENKVCWGRSSSGELGNGSTADQFVPTPVNAF